MTSFTLETLVSAFKLCQIMGWPATSKSGFGVVSDKGRNLVPKLCVSLIVVAQRLWWLTPTAVVSTIQTTSTREPDLDGPPTSMTAFVGVDALDPRFRGNWSILTEFCSALWEEECSSQEEMVDIDSCNYHSLSHWIHWSNDLVFSPPLKMKSVQTNFTPRSREGKSDPRSGA